MLSVMHIKPQRAPSEPAKTMVCIIHESDARQVECDRKKKIFQKLSYVKVKLYNTTLKTYHLANKVMYGETSAVRWGK